MTIYSRHLESSDFLSNSHFKLQIGAILPLTSLSEFVLNSCRLIYHCI